MPTSDRILAWALGRPAALLAAPLILGGCLAIAPDDGKVTARTGGGGGGLSAIFSTHSRPIGDPLPKAPLAGGNLVVRGPDGYCVDGTSLNNRASGGFALIASCQVLSGGDEGARVGIAVMTVSAVPAVEGDKLPDADAFGAAFAPTRVLWTGERQGVRLVHLAAGGDALFDEADPRYWRGLIALNGHVISLAAYGPEGSAAASSSGGRLLIDLAAAMRAASPNLPARQAPAVPAAPVEVAPDAAAKIGAEATGTSGESGNSTQAKGLGRLFSGLFQ